MKKEKLQIGEIINFGKYNNKSIKWKIINKNRNGYLLVSENIIEQIKFGNNNKYKGSFVEEWLNNDFLKNFTEKEVKMINNHFDLNDKVFILSKDEIERYFPNKNNRIKKYNDETWCYWTRTPCSNSFLVCRVGSDGSFCRWNSGCEIYRGIMPALYLNSNIYKSDKIVYDKIVISR